MPDSPWSRSNTVCRLAHNPIIMPDMLPGTDGANINGPSLIRVPGWLPRPHGRSAFTLHTIGVLTSASPTPINCRGLGQSISPERFNFLTRQAVSITLLRLTYISMTIAWKFVCFFIVLRPTAAILCRCRRMWNCHRGNKEVCRWRLLT